MAKSNWAGASFDVLKQVFGCLTWGRGSSYGPYLLVCKQWAAPARSAVERLAMRGTSAQLQAVLDNYSGLCSLNLLNWPGLSAKNLCSLIHFQHICCLDVRVDNTSTLESVHTLTHLEDLKIIYGNSMEAEETLHLPCTDFSRLTRLQVETELQEPPDTFLYLTKLQALRHLSLCTAAPSGFNYAALSLLTCLTLDNFDLENLEALQQLPQLESLGLMGYPSDVDILMLANLTKLTALEIEYINEAELQCHLSAVVMLSSLVNLESLRCDLVDGSAQYSVDILSDLADAIVVVSIPGAPFPFRLS